MRHRCRTYEHTSTLGFASQFERVQSSIVGICTYKSLTFPEIRVYALCLCGANTDSEKPNERATFEDDKSFAINYTHRFVC